MRIETLDFIIERLELQKFHACQHMLVQSHFQSQKLLHYRNLSRLSKIWSFIFLSIRLANFYFSHTWAITFERFQIKRNNFENYLGIFFIRVIPLNTRLTTMTWYVNEVWIMMKIHSIKTILQMNFANFSESNRIKDQRSHCKALWNNLSRRQYCTSNLPCIGQ